MADDKMQSLEYWMGKVDATLAEVKRSIEALAASDKRNWNEFHIWRRGVDDRLGQGTMKFDEHEKRLSEHEKRLHRLEQIHISGEDDDNERYVSWPWIRDKIIVPVVVPFILVAITTIIVVNYLMTTNALP